MDETHECCAALCQFVVNMMAGFGSESTVGFIPVNIGSWQSCNARDIKPSHWVGLILDIRRQSVYAVDSWPLTTYDLEVALVRRRFTLAASKVLETPLAERAFNVPSQPGDNECGLSLPLALYAYQNSVPLSTKGTAGMTAGELYPFCDEAPRPRVTVP